MISYWKRDLHVILYDNIQNYFLPTSEKIKSLSLVYSPFLQTNHHHRKTNLPTVEKIYLSIIIDYNIPQDANLLLTKLSLICCKTNAGDFFMYKNMSEHTDRIIDIEHWSISIIIFILNYTISTIAIWVFCTCIG